MSPMTNPNPAEVTSTVLVKPTVPAVEPRVDVAAAQPSTTGGRFPSWDLLPPTPMIFRRGRRAK